MKPSTRWIGLALIAGLFLGARLHGADDGEKDDKDLAALQGRWELVGKDQTGAEMRVVKTVDGNRETLETFRDKELIHAHTVDFKLRRTDEVRIFTYSNRVITAGPSKGVKEPEKVSYIYQVRGDQWITVEGLMNADPDEALPSVRGYTRVKPGKKVARAPGERGA